MADIVTADQVDLARALRNIEESLSEVLSSIHKLNEESRQAKEEITEVFGRKLSHLHGRETQLLRQVDVIFRARSEVLQNQLAYCYRFLGALKSPQEWKDQALPNIITLENMDFSGSMKRWPASNELNWNLNEHLLNEAIANFGHVDMDGVLMLSRGEQSKCLPARIEEYFEDEHHVMNKPLHSMDSNVIEMKFPKLPKDYSFWLSHNKSQEDRISLEQSYGPYRKGVDNFKPCDVQTWLGCIQGETAAEPMDEADENLPDIVSLSDSTSVSTSGRTSSSIEIVSSSMLCNKANEYDFFSSGLCNQALVDVEIESLGDMFNACRNDKQAWLASTNKRNENIALSKVCRANSMCESFDSCVCDTNCQETAKKNRQDKEKQLVNKILPEMNDIGHWLHPVTSTMAESRPEIVEYSKEDYSQWLRPVALGHKNKDDVNLQVKIKSLSLQSDADTDQMLSSKSIDSVSVDNKWLRASYQDMGECKEMSTKVPVEIMQNPWAQWLTI